MDNAELKVFIRGAEFMARYLSDHRLIDSDTLVEADKCIGHFKDQSNKAEGNDIYIPEPPSRPEPPRHRSIKEDKRGQLMSDKA